VETEDLTEIYILGPFSHVIWYRFQEQPVGSGILGTHWDIMALCCIPVRPGSMSREVKHQVVVVGFGQPNGP
jgi:hypothetical protein